MKCSFKKPLIFLLMITPLLLSAPVKASILVADQDPPDLGAFWTGSDFNDGKADNLINASEATETGWLQYGLLNNTIAITYYGKWQAGPDKDFDEDLEEINIATPFNWDYAIVKWDGFWAAYYDNDNSNTLTHPVGFITTGIKGNGVSHITWFTAQPVPVPPTVLLLASGIAGIAAFRRRFSKGQHR